MSSETSNNHVEDATNLLAVADSMIQQNNVSGILPLMELNGAVANLVAMAQVHATLALATKDW